MLTSVRKLFKNTLFRLSLLGAILFVVSMFVSLGYVYFATISSELRRVDKSIITEIQGLQELYDEEGKLVAVTMVKRETRSSSQYDENHVDGMSGATKTAEGVNTMLLKYMKYYQKYFDTLNADKVELQATEEKR